MTFKDKLLTEAFELNLVFGAPATSPAWPALKPLIVYRVPSTKKLMIHGFSIKTASAGVTYLGLFARKALWKFAATAIATPAAPTLAVKTVNGGGLTVSSTYRYILVARNAVGTTVGSTAATIALGASNNSVTITIVYPTGTNIIDIYRSPANGGAGTEIYLRSTTLTSVVDVASDSELTVGVSPPVSNTTAGSVVGESYISGQGCNHVVLDVTSAITAATTLDVVYRNVWNDRKYLSITTGTTAGSQQFLRVEGNTNPVADGNIPVPVGFEYQDISINSIVNIGNTPVTGAFNIYGYKQLHTSSSGIGTANVWALNQRWDRPTLVDSGEELVIAISSSVAVTTAAQVDLIVYATLE